MVVLAQVFTFLVPRLVGSVAFAGSLAAAFIALAWLSFTFQALLYGAAWVRVRETSRPAGQCWAVPQRRQNRAVAESDRPQLTQGWTAATGRSPTRSRRDLAVGCGPERLDAAGRDGRSTEERQAGGRLLRRPLGGRGPLRIRRGRDDGRRDDDGGASRSGVRRHDGPGGLLDDVDGGRGRGNERLGRRLGGGGDRFGLGRRDGRLRLGRRDDGLRLDHGGDGFGLRLDRHGLGLDRHGSARRDGRLGDHDGFGCGRDDRGLGLGGDDGLGLRR